MDEMESFSPHFIGMKVTFTDGHAGTWVLTKKLSDTCSQYSPFEARILGGTSGAYGTFACANVNSGETAIMRIFMQIPHAGVLYQTPREKKKQADLGELDYYAESELRGYKKLSQEGCTSMPPLINYKIEKQDADGLIPGGYLVFMLLGRVPGIRLDSVYWDLPPSERERVRQSFRVAWEDCIKAGIHVTETGLRRLFWDREHDKIYITGFQNCETAEPRHIWKDIEWFAWDLAKPPRHYLWPQETQAHPDTSDWEM